MKKKNLKLLILLLVLAALVGGTKLAEQMTVKAEQQAEEEASASVTVFSLDPDAIETLSYTYEDETLTFEKSNDRWVYTDEPEFPLKQSRVQVMANALEEISAVKTIESPDDLSPYGLDEPVCTVTADGQTLLLGDEQELDGYRYISVGDGNVYLTSTDLLSSFSYDLDDMIQNETIPAMTDLRSFTVTAADGSYTIDRLPDSGLAYSDSYEYFLETPDGYQTLDTALTEELIENVTQLSWQECLDWKADDDQLHNTGLDDAPVRVEIRYVTTEQTDSGLTDSSGQTIYDSTETEHSFVLLLSGSYARLDGSRMIYRVSSTLADTLRYTTSAELLPDEVLANDYSDVTQIEATFDGNTILFEKTAETAEAEDGSTTVEIVWKVGEETAEGLADTASTLQNMLSYGSAAAADGTAAEELKLVFHRDNESYPVTELSFRRYSSTDCAAFLDGSPTVLVRRTDVTSLIDTLRDCLPETEAAE